MASLTRTTSASPNASRRDLPLEPGDQLFLGYDAVQLLPVEPTTVYETGPDFWEEATATAMP
jgi:hypothetical protein